MRRYGQFCPIARASEILAERWTPIIIRNLLLGCTTFNAIADGAPGLSRGLLSSRLRELERAGVIKIRAKGDRHGSTYEPTEAGRELWKVLLALQQWGTTWVELTPEHAHPGVVLWAWATGYLRRDRLPRPAYRHPVRVHHPAWSRPPGLAAGRTRRRGDLREAPGRGRGPGGTRTRTARIRTVAPRRDRVARCPSLRSDRADRPPRPGASTAHLEPARPTIHCPTPTEQPRDLSAPIAEKPGPV